MKKMSEILGLSLFTIKEGQSCGTVNDIIVDPLTKQVIYIITNTGNSIFSVSILPFENVMSIGTSFITAQSKDYFVSLGECYQHISNLISIMDLMKAKVMFISGSNIANITDIVIDDLGKLSEIIMDNSVVINAELVSTITRDFIFVSDNEEINAKFSEKKTNELTQSTAQNQVPQPENAVVDSVAQNPEQFTNQDETDTSEQTEQISSIQEQEPTSLQEQETSAQEQDTNSEYEEDLKPAENNTASRIDMSPLVGKRVPKDILDADGSIIVRRGEVLTPRLLEEIKLKNRVTSLI